MGEDPHGHQLRFHCSDFSCVTMAILVPSKAIYLIEIDKYKLLQFVHNFKSWNSKEHFLCYRPLTLGVLYRLSFATRAPTLPVCADRRGVVPTAAMDATLVVNVWNSRVELSSRGSGCIGIGPSTTTDQSYYLQLCTEGARVDSKMRVRCWNWKLDIAQISTCVSGLHTYDNGGCKHILTRDITTSLCLKVQFLGARRNTAYYLRWMKKHHHVSYTH